MNRTQLPRLLVVLLLVLVAAAPALAGVNATIGVNDNRLQGADANGNLLLYSPDPVQPGSSISHWDTSAFPNLLMEPAINADLPFLGLDVTPAQMQDIGWTLGSSQVTIWALDPPGFGFDDPRKFDGAPGNPATTLGDARVNLFNAVLGAWANTLESPVNIDVLVSWSPQFCDPAQGAVLGAASTTFIYASNDGSLPHDNVWYHAALTEALVGMDVTGSPLDGGGDIIVFINDSLDDGCLGPGTSFYYGLDGNNPSNQIDLAPVVVHEIGHGLGFANFTTEATGKEFACDDPNDPCFDGLPGIFDLFTLDTTSGKTWDQMTDDERIASAINFRKVVWDGANASAAAATTLDPGVPELTVTAPAEVAGSYEVGTALFGPSIPPGGVAGEIVCLRDGVPDVTVLNGCTPAINPGELAGKIALIDRGACNFTVKVANAQAAGAIAAIIVNNAGNTPNTLGGSDPAIAIPAISLGRRDGNRIREAACPDSALLLGDDRFQVTAFWATDTDSGPATSLGMTKDSGFFYFFDPDNVELVVKVLNACSAPEFNRFWVFAGGLTNVEVDLTVVDTQTGRTKIYSNPLDHPFEPIQDTDAFATCP
jgi:PA domain